MSNNQKLVELPVNCLNPHYAEPQSLFGVNGRRWGEALEKLGLVAIAPRPALSIAGERLPGVPALLHDKGLFDLGQYALLSMVCRNSVEGLGVHMVKGLRAYLDRKSPVVLPGVEPRELTVDDILADIARATVGKEQRHPDIHPRDFTPMLEVCRGIGTLSLLQSAG